MSVRRLRARCPAKVNLSLRVLGRRTDGYHELDTVFQAIELWDEVVARESDELVLTCDDPGLPTDDTNLVLRAARRLRQEFPDGAGRGGARIELCKGIPAGAGLGGGSSDAAGALVLLAKLWELSCPMPALVELASELGADVPFFLHGGTARGTGRGDRIEPLPFAGPLSILIGLPPFRISTADVYRRLTGLLTPPGKDVTVRRFSKRHKWPRDNDLSLPASNDLEGVVFASWPELAGFRDALVGAGAGIALLSGSGSAVFGIFDEPGGVEAAKRELAPRCPGWTFFSTRAAASGVELVESCGESEAGDGAGA